MKMNTYDLILSRRSIRQFLDKSVPRDLIERCIDAARLAPSSANKQPLEFIALSEDEICRKLFPCLTWAAYLKDWSPPVEKRPRAYVTIAVDKGRALAGFAEYDIAFAASHVILVAQEEGVASCAIVAFDKNKVKDLLGVPADYDLPLIIALGYPAETAVVEEMKDSCEYWRDDDDIHHVPKRPLKDLIHWEMFQD